MILFCAGKGACAKTGAGGYAQGEGQRAAADGPCSAYGSAVTAIVSIGCCGDNHIVTAHGTGIGNGFGTTTISRRSGKVDGTAACGDHKAGAATAA